MLHGYYSINYLASVFNHYNRYEHSLARLFSDIMMYLCRTSITCALPLLLVNNGYVESILLATITDARILSHGTHIKSYYITVYLNSFSSPQPPSSRRVLSRTMLKYHSHFIDEFIVIIRFIVSIFLQTLLFDIYVYYPSSA